jgi:DNA-directed RNA polymerase beta subunit
MGLFDIYMRDNSLVKQQIESFNKFIDFGMQDVVLRNPLIKTNVEGFEIKLGKVRVAPPRFYEVKGGYKQILPMEARLRNFNYSSPIFLEMILVQNGVERPSYSEIYIGDIPIMVKSKHCYLSSLSKDDLTACGEDQNDPGGYFIINGSERVLISIEDLVPNRLIATRESKTEKNVFVVAKVFSTRQGFRARCVMELNMRTNELQMEFPSAPRLLPTLVMRALGVDQDTDILAFFNEDKAARDIVNGNMKLEHQFVDEYMAMIKKGQEDQTPVSGREAAVEILSRRMFPGQPAEYRISKLEGLLDQYLLPHIGITPDDRRRKAEYLGQMMMRAIKVAHHKMPQDDKDHYSNKRVKLAGELMEELFNYALGFLVKDIIYQASRANARGRRLQVQTLIRQDAMADRIRYAMATGNWIAGQTGVSQLLDRTSSVATLSHLRRIVSPLSKKHPHFKARDLHGTQWGKLCPNETPEGPSCSLVKNLSIMSEVSTGVDDSSVFEMLKTFGVGQKQG